MALNDKEAALRCFVLAALQLMGAAFSTPDEELVLAVVRVVKPGGFFSPPRVEEEHFQLVFSREGAEKYPSAELVAPGRPRFDWFIHQARARGFLTRGFYAGPCGLPELERLEREVRARLPLPWAFRPLRLEGCAYTPYFLALFKLAFLTGERKEEIWPVVLDLREGTQEEGLAARLREGPFTATPPVFWPRLRRRLPWREVWSRLRQGVEKRIAALDPAWYRPALTRLKQELAVVRHYYLAVLGEGADAEAVQAEYTRRAEELVAMWAPSVEVTLLNGALLYLPLVRLCLVDEKGRAFPLAYRPVGGRLRWEKEPPSGAEGGVEVNPS